MQATRTWIVIPDCRSYAHEGGDKVRDKVAGMGATFGNRASGKLLTPRVHACMQPTHHTTSGKAQNTGNCFRRDQATRGPSAMMLKLSLALRSTTFWNACASAILQPADSSLGRQSCPASGTGVCSFLPVVLRAGNDQVKKWVGAGGYW